MKIFKKILIVWSIIILIVCSLVIADFSGENQDEKIEKVGNTSFSYPVPIKINGYIFQNKQYSELHISLKNNTRYIISAVKFFVECYDVYGEDMGFDKNYIYQKYCIEEGNYRTATCIIPRNTKSVKIYTYSVYYKNNYIREWGSRKIKKTALKTFVPYTHIEYAY